MEAKLVVVRGKASRGHIALKLPTIIGRSREADLTVAHPTISRKHCEIYEEGGALRIRDLGSLNGTFVGKRQIKESELDPNAEFSLGPLTFRILYERDGQAAVSAPPAPAADADEVPDFILQEESTEESDYALQGEEPTPASPKTSPQPARSGSNGASPHSDEDVLDFLMDEEPKAKKAADGGADDDELDQFFKDLG